MSLKNKFLSNPDSLIVFIKPMPDRDINSNNASISYLTY